MNGTPTGTTGTIRPVGRRTFLSWSAVVAAGGVLAACGDGGTSGSETPQAGTTETGAAAAVAGGRIVIDQALEPRVMNTITVNYQYLRWLSEPVEETLYRYDDSGAVVPLLADGMPVVSDDELTWTVKLRSGVTYHNGDAFSAETVVPTFAAAKEKGQWAAHFGAWLDTVTALDEQTVQFVLSQPYGIFIDKLVALPIGHPDFIENNEKLMGTGPYVFQEYNQGSDLLLVRNDSYWGESPLPDELQFRFIADAGAALVNVINGDSTIYAEPRPSDAETLSGQANVELRDVEAPYQILWWTNVTRGPFDDVRVRQAMAHAMNRQRVVDVVYAGRAAVAQGMIGPSMQGYDSSFQPYKPEGDIEKAKQLLAEAGFGEDQPVEFELVTTAGSVTQSLGTVLQQDWAAAGLKVNLSFLELGAWAERWFAKDFDVILLPDMSGFAQGRTPFNMVISNITGSPSNHHGYSNPEYDDVVARSVASSDEAERIALWGEANRIIVEDAVSVPPAFPHLLVAHSKEMSGMADGALNLGRLNFPQYSLSR